MGNRIAEAVRAALPVARSASLGVFARWREGAAWREAEAAFAADVDPVAAASRLLADERWAADLLAPLVQALDADPLFDPPLRLSRDAVRTGAVLFDCPAVSISGSVIDVAALAAMPAPETIVFTGRMTVTRYVKAGGATLRRWKVDAPMPAPCRPCAPVMPSEGEVRVIDGSIESQLPGDARSDIVLLTATIRDGAAPLIREHRAADGVFVRAGSADDAASRVEMLLTLLRLSGRTDAAEQFDAASRDPAFHLRWAAMREWLALDARTALPRLERMALDDPDSDVRTAAARTLPPVRERIAAACLA